MSENFDSDELKDMNIQLSELGAIIINSDGTMSKISNWHELTKPEQVKALRVIAKRNAKRKKDLISQTESEDGGVTDVGSAGKDEEEGEKEILAIENK